MFSSTHDQSFNGPPLAQQSSSNEPAALFLSPSFQTFSSVKSSDLRHIPRTLDFTPATLFPEDDDPVALEAILLSVRHGYSASPSAEYLNPSNLPSNQPGSASVAPLRVTSIHRLSRGTRRRNRRRFARRSASPSPVPITLVQEVEALDSDDVLQELFALGFAFDKISPRKGFTRHRIMRKSSFAAFARTPVHTRAGRLSRPTPRFIHPATVFISSAFYEDYAFVFPWFPWSWHPMLFDAHLCMFYTFIMFFISSSRLISFRTWSAFVAPVAEELLKSMFVTPWAFAFYELHFHVEKTGFDPCLLPAFAFHMVTAYWSFWPRVACHFWFNLFTLQYHNPFVRMPATVFAEPLYSAEYIKQVKDYFKPQLLEMFFQSIMFSYFPGQTFTSRDALIYSSYLMNLVTQNSIAGITAVVANFALVQHYDSVVSMFHQLKTCMEASIPSGFQPEGKLEQFDKMLDGASNLIGSPIFNWIRTLVTGAVCIPFFASMGLKFQAKKLGLFSADMYKSADRDRLPFVICVARSVRDIFGHGLKFISGEGDLTIFKSSTPFTSFIESAIFLKTMRNFTTSGKSTDSLINSAQFRRNLVEAIAEGKRLIVVSHGLDPGIRSQIVKFLADLSAIEERLLTADLASDKDAAFILICVAPPGVGKSVFITMVHMQMEAASGRPFHKNAVAVIDPTSKFLDHVNNGHSIIHIEEVGIETIKAHEKMDVTPIKWLLAFGDSNPQVINKSAVEDKGRTVNCNEYATACTNSLNINAQLDTRFAAAVYRRINWVEIRVKDEYRLVDSVMADPLKIAGLGNMLIDIYQARIVSVPSGETSGKIAFDKQGEPLHRIYGDWLSVDEYFKVLKTVLTKFQDSQKLRREAHEAISTTACKHGSWAQICSDCLESPMTPEAEEIKVLPVERSISRFIYLSYRTVLCFLISSWYQILVLIMGALIYIAPTNIVYALFMYIFRNSLFVPVEQRAASYRAQFWNCLDSMIDIGRGKVQVKVVNERLRVALISSCAKSKKLYDTKIFTNNLYLMLASATGAYCLSCFVTWWKSETFSFQGSALGVPLKSETHVDIDNLAERLRELGVRTSPLRATKDDPRSVWSETNSPTVVLRKEHQLPQHHLTDILSKQSYEVTVETSESMVNCKCTAIAPEIIMMNSHCIGVGGLVTLTKVFSTSENVNRVARRFVQQITPDNIHIVNSDVCLVFFQSLQAKDVTKKMPDAYPTSYFRSIQVPGCLIDDTVEPIETKLVYSQVAKDVKIPIGYEYLYPHHRVGLCGSAIILSMGSGHYFGAIHTAGSLSSFASLASAFIKSEVDVAVKKIRSQSEFCRLTPEGQTREFTIDGAEPMMSSPSNYSLLQWATANVIYEGSVTNLTYNEPRPKMTYLVTAPLVKQCLGITNTFEDGSYKWGIPRFKSGKDDTIPSGYFNPYAKWGEKSFHSSDFLDKPFVIKAIADFWTQIEDSSIEWYARPLDMVSIISGDGKVSTLNSMNMSSSMGFGTKGKKVDYSYSFPTNQAPDGKMFTDDILNDYIETIKVYKSGNTVRPINKASLKSEPRVREEVDGVITTKNPRIFCATPNIDTLIGRAFLLPVLNKVKDDRNTFECAVGINCMSREWGKRRDFFNDVLASSFGSDISGFDTRMPITIKHAAMTIVMRMASKLGYNSVELLILQGYLTDAMYPLILINNDLLTMPNLIVSGRVGTAEFNSLCLSIIYRTVFYKIAAMESSPLTFRGNVRLMTYGDDSKAGSLVPWFNQETFCLGAQSMGIIATTAAKSLILARFLPFDTEEFLHRYWRWDEEYSVWCAPLAFDSMARSLTLNNTSSIGSELQAWEASKSINYELAQHGREVFESKMAGLNELLRLTGLVDKFGPPDFKSFKEIMDQCYE